MMPRQLGRRCGRRLNLDAQFTGQNAKAKLLADAPPGWRCCAHRQKLGGKPDPALGIGSFQLVIRGALRSGRRAAAVMTLIQSAKLNGHGSYAYLKGGLTRLPT